MSTTLDQNLSHIQIRITEQRTAKWHFVARYFLSSRLALLDSRFCSPGVLCPSSSEPSSYYRNCLRIFARLHDKLGSLPDDLSCKNVYLLLLDLPAVAPRCAGFWGSVVNHPINRWASVCRKSRLKLIENKKNDLIWLLINRVVRVHYALKSWKIIENDKCTVCNQRETIEHCFIECQRVVRVCILSRFLDYPFVLSSSSVFYPFSEAQSSTGISLSNYLIATILFWIWNARNQAFFGSSVLDSAKIMLLIKKDIESRIICAPLDSKRHFCSFRNALCIVDSSNNVIVFRPLV